MRAKLHYCWSPCANNISLIISGDPLSQAVYAMRAKEHEAKMKHFDNLQREHIASMQLIEKQNLHHEAMMAVLKNKMKEHALRMDMLKKQQ